VKAEAGKPSSNACAGNLPHPKSDAKESLMRAALVHSFDASPRYVEFPDPVAGEEETLIDVTAAGFHPVVKALASGSHYASATALPFIPGVDGVGRLQDGTRVFFGAVRSPFGTLPSAR
jgi:D-arabinose 1-dehydrogenase-like Zn-dependent alcohol dehydrogenase